MLLTVAAGSGFLTVNRAAAAGAWAQPAGPPSVSGRSRAEASSNHAAAGMSHCFLAAPCMTTGSYRSGATCGESSTW